MEALTIIQTGDDGGLDQGGSSAGVLRSDWIGVIMERKSQQDVASLGVGCERTRGVKDASRDGVEKGEPPTLLVGM